MSEKWDDLISEMKTGSIRALSRLITWVEDREPGWMEAMRMIYAYTGKARVIGITGSPGAGKSTLTNQITCELVKKGLKVGIIAVDPSSPFSGGAILGDRIRMKEISSLNGVFIRSMATRGALGGLSQAARDVAKIMDAFGMDMILIETVGVGQDEVEVVKAADLVLVVCVPGQGDGIQAIKAGVMEIADIFVVNKADREGADQIVLDIQAMLDLDVEIGKDPIPVCKTIATTGEGISELLTLIFERLGTKVRSASWHEERAREELLMLMEKEVAQHILKQWKQNGDFDRAVKQVAANEKDPYSIVNQLMSSIIFQSKVY